LRQADASFSRTAAAEPLNLLPPIRRTRQNPSTPVDNNVIDGRLSSVCICVSALLLPWPASCSRSSALSVNSQDRPWSRPRDVTSTSCWQMATSRLHAQRVPRRWYCFFLSSLSNPSSAAPPLTPPAMRPLSSQPLAMSHAIAVEVVALANYHLHNRL